MTFVAFSSSGCGTQDSDYERRLRHYIIVLNFLLKNFFLMYLSYYY